MLLFRCREEINETLSRLKRMERELSAKEKSLLERESNIRRREADLEKQLNVVVSYAPCSVHCAPCY